MKKVIINITQKQIKEGYDGSKIKVRKMIIKGIINHNDFDEHDTAGILVAIEYGANNQNINPIRAHISVPLELDHH